MPAKTEYTLAQRLNRANALRGWAQYLTTRAVGVLHEIGDLHREANTVGEGSLRTSVGKYWPELYEGRLANLRRERDTLLSWARHCLADATTEAIRGLT